LKRKEKNKPLTMTQGGGKPTFVVLKRVGSKNKTLEMLEGEGKG
jgi:hypothetical protein